MAKLNFFAEWLPEFKLNKEQSINFTVAI